MSLGYDMVYAAGAVVAGPFLAYRLIRTGKWRTDWPSRFGRLKARPSNDRPVLLVHAVSVGEVNAAAALVNKVDELTQNRPEGAWRIVVSTTTDTGLARAREVLEPRHEVVRYPLDLGPCVRYFLDRIRPDVVALIELELWPNFVRDCRRRLVPVCVMNGRLSRRSFKRYRAVRPLVRRTFAQLAAAAVQNDDYARRFAALGTDARRIRVIDSIKWDGIQVQDPQCVPGADELADAFGLDRDEPVVVAGSTGPDEEKMFIEGLSQWPKGTQLILVPRRPQRFDEVAAFDPGMVRRSRHTDGTRRTPDGSQLFLLDTMGELAKAYALADVALVGRSFLGLHGSNPIEPIALGRPTIIGPFHEDFADMVQALRGDGMIVSEDPIRAVTDLLADPSKAGRMAENGRRVILSHRGGTEAQARIILDLMAKSLGAMT